MYLYLKPMLGVQFIHHVMLSLGRFATEIDLTMQPTIRESLRYAKLIEPSNDKDELEKYDNSDKNNIVNYFAHCYKSCLFSRMYFVIL